MLTFHMSLPNNDDRRHNTVIESVDAASYAHEHAISCRWVDTYYALKSRRAIYKRVPEEQTYAATPYRATLRVLLVEAQLG